MSDMRDLAIPALTRQAGDLAALTRLAAWATGAAVCLAIAILAARSESGSARLSRAVELWSGQARPSAPPALAQRPSEAEEMARRLAEQVRLLAADRDRLMQRVSLIEQGLHDVTGSIESVRAASRPAAPPAPIADAAPPKVTEPAPTPDAAAPAATDASPPGPSAQAPVLARGEPSVDTVPAWPAASLVPSPPGLVPPTPSPRPEPAAPAAEATAPEAVALPARAPSVQTAARTPRPEPAAPARPAYGVDLGGAVSHERLRLLWNASRGAQPQLFHNLRPLVSARRSEGSGRPDLRLVAGPLASAEEARRLCAILLHAGRFCEPAPFDGQRLR